MKATHIYIKAYSFALILGLLGQSSFATLPESTVRESFARANTLYDSAQYVAAISEYEKIRASGVESAPLYYNLGNCYFETKDVGHAVLNYLRAKRLDPSDQDINDNLRFAQGFVKVQVEGVELNPVSTALSSITSQWSLTNWGWLTSGLFFLLGALLTARVIFAARGAFNNILLWSSAMFFIAAVSLTTFKFTVEFSPRRATLVVDDVPVASKPSATNEIEFRGAAGMEVEIHDEENGRYLAIFANKRQGWVPVSAVERL